MFLFNSGSACLVLAMICAALSTKFNTDRYAVSFSVLASMLYVISVLVFPGGTCVYESPSLSSSLSPSILESMEMISIFY